MNFLRRNVFYVVLLAVVLLCGAGLFYLSSAKGKDFNSLLAERSRLGTTLNGLSRQEPVNARIIEARKEQNAAAEKQAKQAFQQAMELNKKTPMTMPDSTGASQPAFPLPADRNPGLFNDAFVEQYLSELAKLPQALDPTRPPTANEVQLEQAEAVTQIEQEIEAEQRRAAAANPAAPKPDPAIVNMDKQAESQKRGREAAIAIQANGGAVYVDPDALDAVFADKSSRGVTDQQLWNAQVNMWVQQDILKAIAATNSQAAVNGRKVTVPSALVKRLIKIQVQEPYYTGQATGSAGAPAGGYEESTANEEEGHGHGGGGGHAAPPAPAMATPTGTGGVATLTQRITNNQYEVIQYSVEVVASLHDLAKFEEQLQTQPYNTVLSIDWRAINPAQTDPYYYGTEPMVDATINAECVMLAEWTRPLMPVPVLQDLAKAVPGSLRDEDNKRIEGAPQDAAK